MGKGFFYADGMWEMDQNVGKLLGLLDNLHIAEDTIVIFTTDNGPNQWAWPYTAVTPFRGEKDTNWEGAFRVPAMIRWPGRIKAGKISTELFSGLDWFPTLLAAAGDTTIKDRLLKGTRRTAAFLQTFIEYPRSQAPASFSIDQIVEGINKKLEQMQQQPKN